MSKAQQGFGIIVAAIWAGCAGSPQGRPAFDGGVGEGGLPDATAVDHSVPPGTDASSSADAVPGSDLAGPADAESEQPLVFRPSPPHLRRLTISQYGNSLRDLFGGDIKVPTELEPDTSLNGFVSIAASRTTLSLRGTEQFEAAAFDVAHQVTNSAGIRAAVVGCVPKGPVDTTCARLFVTSFGRRAWRRPLTADEIDRYLALQTKAATELGDFWSAVEFVLASFVQSPNFLYREELGQPDSTRPDQRVLKDYELAARLSFALWDSPPDDELLRAAATESLRNDEQLRVQAMRLLASPRARTALGSFFGEWLHLGGLDDLKQTVSAFPVVTRTLGPAMRQETLLFADDIVFARNTDFREFFYGRSTFVNQELARLYGLPVRNEDGFWRVDLPENGLRVGILGKASFLATYAHPTTTSPTLRGKFIREILLCQAIPPPPPGVVTMLPEQEPGNAPRTMRQKLETHRQIPTCAGCHALIDPLGLGLEHFDAVGAARTADNGLPIDASGDFDGVRFQNARELAALVGRHPDVATCMARSFFRYFMGHVEGEGEEMLVQSLGRGLATGGFRLRDLILSFVESPAFRYVGRLEASDGGAGGTP